MSEQEHQMMPGEPALLAEEWIAQLNQACGFSAGWVIKTGDLLLQAKQELPHGTGWPAEHRADLAQLLENFALAGELTEQAHRLSAPEMNALLGLTRSPAERAALRKALDLIQTDPTGAGPGSKTPPPPE